MIQSTPTKLLVFITCFVLFILVDLYLSDYLVQIILQGVHIDIPWFKLNYLENTGAAFNIMKDAKEALIIFSASAITLIFVYVYNHIKKLSASTLIWLSLLCAGTFGNMHERIHLGCVRDFFELTIINFPVFNVSDIMINISVFALIIIILFNRGK